MQKRPLYHAMLVLALTSAGCAVNRSHVKSLNDPDASRIRFDPPIVTSIVALNALAPRCGPAGNRRVRAEEFSTYQVVGRITRVSRKRDHDVHVVLTDVATSLERIVVEIDDPDFRANATSPYHSQLVAARRAFDALAGSALAGGAGLVGSTVRVTGVGFFDLNHFQRGRASASGRV